MKPKRERIWIDARNEKNKSREIKELKFKINNLEEQNTLRTIYQAIGYYVQSLEICDHSLLVTYDTHKINPTFIEYLLRQRDIHPMIISDNFHS